MPWLGPAVVATVLAIHLSRAPRRIAEITLIAVAAGIGTVWDSFLVSMGWLVYPAGTFVAGMAPYWIIALWIVFATTLNVSMRWLKGRLMLTLSVVANTIHNAIIK